MSRPGPNFTLFDLEREFRSWVVGAKQKSKGLVAFAVLFDDQVLRDHLTPSMCRELAEWLARPEAPKEFATNWKKPQKESFIRLTPNNDHLIFTMGSRHDSFVFFIPRDKWAEFAAYLRTAAAVAEVMAAGVEIDLRDADPEVLE